jgi:hypothetical protein
MTAVAWPGRIESGDPEQHPTIVRVDELVADLGAEELRVWREVPLGFDVSGDRVVVLFDGRGGGGPVLAFQLATTTAYAVAMAVLKMRRRVLREKGSTGS